MYKGQKESYKLIKYLRKTKVDELLERVKKDSNRNWLMVLTLWKTGIRNSELVELKKADIRDDEIIIRKGKGNKPRMIPLDPTLRDLLMFYSSKITNEVKLFPLTTAQIRNIVHKYQKDEYLKPHMFRHSFAVHCLLQGMNIRALQKILGHSELSTTAVYLDLIGKDIKDEYKKITW